MSQRKAPPYHRSVGRFFRRKKDAEETDDGETIAPGIQETVSGDGVSPALTADAGALCVSACNAAILRCGSESLHSSAAILARLRGSLAEAGLT